jgi:hypothetical protein
MKIVIIIKKLLIIVLLKVTHKFIKLIVIMISLKNIQRKENNNKNKSKD